MNSVLVFAVGVALVFALFTLTAVLVGAQLAFPLPSFGDVAMRRRIPAPPPASVEEASLWAPPGAPGLVDRAAALVARVAPPQFLEWLRPRMAAAGQRQPPEVVLGEALTGTVFTAAALAAVCAGFRLPFALIALALSIPGLWWLRISQRLGRVKQDVESEVASVLVVASSVARATTGLEGPRGLLPYLISEIDCTFCDLLHQAVIEASARGGMVEDVLEEMAEIYGLPVLITVANAFRSWRRQGVALSKVLAAAANSVMEAQLGEALRKAYVRNTVSVLPVAIFDLPALLLLLLTPALARLLGAHGLLG